MSQFFLEIFVFFFQIISILQFVCLDQNKVCVSISLHNRFTQPFGFRDNIVCQLIASVCWIILVQCGTIIVFYLFFYRYSAKCKNPKICIFSFDCFFFVRNRWPLTPNIYIYICILFGSDLLVMHNAGKLLLKFFQLSDLSYT